MTKLLVVEDDATIRAMMTRRLEFEGFTVITAPDGIAGIMQARTEQPDVILMDMGLPKLNGWQATARLKANPLTAGIPIIAVTAYALEEDRQRSLNVGCDGFATKPIEFDQLLRTIAQVSQRKEK